MKRLLLLAVLSFAFIAPSMAGRVLPRNMEVAVVKSYKHPELVLSPDGFSWLKVLTLGWLNGAQTFKVSGDVVVHNKKNFTVNYGRLQSHIGEPVGVRFDEQGVIVEIWILTDGERDTLRRRAEALSKYK
ncbi:MAG: hypothetical protein IKZ88_05805 [Neisseriaceae bacterium]|nr:hypothetical protein [Neisseriaceae bacterium]